MTSGVTGGTIWSESHIRTLIGNGSTVEIRLPEVGVSRIPNDSGELGVYGHMVSYLGQCNIGIYWRHIQKDLTPSPKCCFRHIAQADLI